MRKLYEKSELTFTIVWIVVYCVLQSLANPLNQKIGVEYSASAIFSILQSVILLVFLVKKQLTKTIWALQISYICQPLSVLYSIDNFSHKKFLERSGI